MRINKLLLLGTLAFSVSLSSCKKDNQLGIQESNSASEQQVDNGNNKKSEFIVSFENEEEYIDYLNQAKIIFSSGDKNVQGVSLSEVEINNDFVPSKKQLKELESVINNVDFQGNFIKNKNDHYSIFIDKFPKMTNMNNVYNYYIKALNNGDLKSWNSVVKEYPDLFRIENDILMLNHLEIVSSLINLQGAYEVGQELIVYNGSSINIFDKDNYQIKGARIYTQNAREISDNELNSSRGYTLRFTYTHLYPANIRMIINGYDDKVWVGYGFEWYGKVEGYTQYKVGSTWTPLLCSEFISGVEMCQEPYGTTGGVYHYNSYSGVASGHIITTYANISLKGTVIFKVLPGWAYLSGSTLCY
ncbi:MAG: hypothetical protein ACPGD5_00500 [Salibacteraceae bacterium]